jgi:hypothetical protein
MPEAENVSEPATPAAEAFMVFACVPVPEAATVAPSVQPPTVAIPLTVAGVVGAVRLPPPVRIENVTVTPDSGLLKVSLTTTDGAVGTAVPIRAIWLLPTLIAMLAAAVGLTVTFWVWVRVRKFAVAETVWSAALVEL